MIPDLAVLRFESSLRLLSHPLPNWAIIFKFFAGQGSTSRLNLDGQISRLRNLPRLLEVTEHFSTKNERIFNSSKYDGKAFRIMRMTHEGSGGTRHKKMSFEWSMPVRTGHHGRVDVRGRSPNRAKGRAFTYAHVGRYCQLELARECPQKPWVIIESLFLRCCQKREGSCRCHANMQIIFQHSFTLQGGFNFLKVMRKYLAFLSFFSLAIAIS